MKQIFKNNKGQSIGWLKEGIFRKRVDSTKHKMKIFDAYGIEESVIEKLKGNCATIRLKEDNNKIYSCSMETMMEKGFVKDFETPQRFLPIKHWTITK